MIIGSPLAHLAYEEQSADESRSDQNVASAEYIFYQTADGSIQKSLFHSIHGAFGGATGLS